MATTADIRNGAVILHKSKRMKIVEFQHVKPGKGGAFVRTKLKDIQSGKIIDETFNAGHKLQFIKVEAKEMQFLYNDNDAFVFMDKETFDQLNVEPQYVGSGKDFLTPGMNVDLLFDDLEVLDVRLPTHVILQVSETEPGFKGNTATGASKPAKLETGYLLNVPLFINEGDKLRIDTRTGEYVERSKD
ncbi:MAG: elongation factor P [Candidatus Marinimicrobia bacterium]|nr:elongation factor P [Candidatus Neomarinimicrobiota bacterium]|tara:strand:+ start:438 stop:1001 length:564 start_codon:yes stop_codon:yes gene_type:complete